jgi:tRNA A-37 threonylcarbamoyl transferase component Bud32
VPTFVSVDVPNGELHMELLEGFRRIEEVLDEEELPDATVTELLDRLLEMMAGLDRVGVAHCDVGKENVLAQWAADGRLELKLVDFGLSKTEEEEESSGRGYVAYLTSRSKRGY